MNWREVDELDEFGIPIIYWTRNGKCGVLSKVRDKNHWERKIEKYNIMFFVYVKEAAPVGILGSDEEGWYSCDADEMYELYKDKRHVTPEDVRRISDNRRMTILSTSEADSDDIGKSIIDKMTKHHIITM